MKRSLAGFCTLTLAAGDAPPSEFRIFAAGVNESRKGRVVFDAEAARLVMAEYRAHGADCMVDLEHLSLDDTAPNYDPDARAWCQLEVRNGELWAVNVRWTPDGEARLNEKRQRYISPTFRRDPKTGRVVELFNIAICAMPATDHLTPLVAAKAKGTASIMKTHPMVLAALGLAEDATDDDVKAAMAEAMKDPAKMVALLSAFAAADAVADAGEGAAMTDKPAEGAPGVKPAIVAAKRGGSNTEVTDALAAELVALRRKVSQGQVRELISANRNKFTPALERWALTSYADDADGLLEWLKAAPVVSAARSTEKQSEGNGGAPGGKGLDAVKLTAADVEMCTKLNRDPKEFLAHKRELAVKRNPMLLNEEG